jgi:hypothetical protein
MGHLGAVYFVLCHLAIILLSCGGGALPVVPVVNVVDAVGPHAGDVTERHLVPDPVGSFTSCDQCNIYEGALWCPANFACTIYNSTNLQGGLAEAHALCQSSCPGSTACIDFLQCYYGAKNCGECLYLGGHWCAAKRTCYPASEGDMGMQSNQHQGGGPNDCRAECGQSSSSPCISEDRMCPECERFDLPLKCSPLLGVIISSSIIGSLFVAAIIGLCVKAQLNARSIRRRFEEEEAAAEAAMDAAAEVGGGSGNGSFIPAGRGREERNSVTGR